MTTPEGWINARAAMTHLGLWSSLPAFNRAVHRLGIPHRKIGHRLLFQRSRLDAWVSAHRGKAA
jgi:hypothetical protein